MAVWRRCGERMERSDEMTETDSTRTHRSAKMYRPQEVEAHLPAVAYAELLRTRRRRPRPPTPRWPRRDHPAAAERHRPLHPSAMLSVLLGLKTSMTRHARMLGRPASGCPASMMPLSRRRWSSIGTACRGRIARGPRSRALPRANVGVRRARPNAYSPSSVRRALRWTGAGWRFTMDESARAVWEAFQRLYRDGSANRTEALANRCRVAGRATPISRSSAAPERDTVEDPLPSRPSGRLP